MLVIFSAEKHDTTVTFMFVFVAFTIPRTTGINKLQLVPNQFPISTLGRFWA